MHFVLTAILIRSTWLLNNCSSMPTSANFSPLFLPPSLRPFYLQKVKRSAPACLASCQLRHRMLFPTSTDYDCRLQNLRIFLLLTTVGRGGTSAIAWVATSPASHQVGFSQSNQSPLGGFREEDPRFSSRCLLRLAPPNKPQQHSSPATSFPTSSIINHHHLDIPITPLPSPP